MVSILTGNISYSKSKENIEKKYLRLVKVVNVKIQELIISQKSASGCEWLEKFKSSVQPCITRNLTCKKDGYTLLTF